MSRFITIDELLADETPELRAEIARRGKEAIKAEHLRRLRELAGKTQDEVVGLRQDGVSRLERRNDMLMSSLNAYVRGLGGKLKLVAELPDVGSVELELTKESRVKGAAAARRSGPKSTVARHRAKPQRKSG